MSYKVKVTLRGQPATYPGANGEQLDEVVLECLGESTHRVLVATREDIAHHQLPGPGETREYWLTPAQ